MLLLQTGSTMATKLPAMHYLFLF